VPGRVDHSPMTTLNDSVHSAAGALEHVTAVRDYHTTTMSSTVRVLSQLFPGQTGRVLEVTAEPVLALNMLEIGLVPGAMVRYLRSAPWGDPIEIEIDGFLLSLRRSEADAIIVGVESDGPAPHQGA
jgi:ferrous iron transport protein A